MGAWGVGHFDNDDAGDWVWELEDTGTASPVTAAFAAVEAEANYLEAPDACIARKARTLAPGGPWSRGCCGVCRRPEIRAHWCLWSGSPVSW